MNLLAHNIKYYRKKLGLTQQELADQINISRSILSRWENGSMTPDVQALLKLSQIFVISLDSLVGNGKGNQKTIHESQAHDRDDEVDQNMTEIVNYLNKQKEIKNGLLFLSRQTEQNRKPIEEVIKTIFRNLK